MIVSKPKTGTLFSLGSFIAICFAVAIYTSLHMLRVDHISWYQYTLVILLYPIGIGLALKVIWGYKIIYIGKGKIEIRYPSRFNTLNYSIRDIGKWKENVVKTATGTYQEIEITFSDNKKVNLSYQEHTNYPQVVKYLKKKCSKKLRT